MRIVSGLIPLFVALILSGCAFVGKNWEVVAQKNSDGWDVRPPNERDFSGLAALDLEKVSLHVSTPTVRSYNYTVGPLWFALIPFPFSEGTTEESLTFGLSIKPKVGELLVDLGQLVLRDSNLLEHRPVRILKPSINSKKTDQQLFQKTIEQIGVDGAFYNIEYDIKYEEKGGPYTILFGKMFSSNDEVVVAPLLVDKETHVRFRTWP